MTRKKFRASPPSSPRASTPPPAMTPKSPSSRAPSAADRDRVCTRRMATNVAMQAQKAKEPAGGESAGSSAPQVMTGIGVATRSRAHTPPRPRYPSEADHDRARARMARDAARQAQVEAGGGEPASPPGEQVVTGIRVTMRPSGVVPVPPRMRLYQVKNKVPGKEDIVRCVLMDWNSGIPDGC